MLSVVAYSSFRTISTSLRSDASASYASALCPATITVRVMPTWDRSLSERWMSGSPSMTTKPFGRSGQESRRRVPRPAARTTAVVTGAAPITPLLP